MSKFSDCLGREWTLRLTLGHRAPLRELGVDTTDVAAAMVSLAQLTGFDADKLAAVCRLLTVEPITVGEDEYLLGWDVATVEAAGEALADAVLGFYLGRQPAAAAALKTKVGEVMAVVDKAMAAALTPSDSATNSPASAASTPARTP